MKQLSLLLITMTLVLNSCVSSPLNIDLASEHISSQKICEFNSIQEPAYKLSANPLTIEFGAYRKPYLLEDVRGSYTTRKYLLGKTVKVVSFEKSRGDVVDSGRLFSVKGKQHIFVDGYLKMITEDCKILYVKTDDVFTNSNKDVLTKLNLQPLDDADKINLSTHMGSAVNELKVSVEKDEFKGQLWLLAPSFDANLLRALIDTNTNKLQFVQIYANTMQLDRWAYLDSAYDRQQNSFALNRISSDVQSSLYYETIGIILPFDYLKTHIGDGIEIQASGRGGKSMIYVPSKSIELMLEAIDKFTIPSKGNTL